MISKSKVMKVMKGLSFQILVAMILGVVIGRVMGPSASMFAPLGKLFLELIRMLVVPLVLISIMSGAASLGASKSAGRIGVVTLTYIAVTTVLAALVGIVFGELFRPGDGVSLQSIEAFMPAQGMVVETPTIGFWDSLLSVIPSNPIKAMVEGNVLQIIFFGLFIGFGLSALPTTKKEPVLGLLNTILDALIWCITKVMWVAPLGVFGLMAEATSSFGYDLLLKVGNLFWVNLLAGLFMLFVFYPVTLKLLTKQSIGDYLKKMFRPQIVALSTSSSLATMPVTLETCEDEFKVSKETASFVVPLGATINMTGSAIYYILVAMFFAQLYGIEMSMAQYIAIVITATVGSIGQAGVPGPSFLVIAVLVSAGIPIEGLPLIYALDRVFDMIRTILNISGDATCAIVVDSMVNRKRSYKQ